MPALLVILIVLALIFGGIGLLVEGLMWLLVIAAIMLVASFIFGFFRNGGGPRTGGPRTRV